MIQRSLFFKFFGMSASNANTTFASPSEGHIGVGESVPEIEEIASPNGDGHSSDGYIDNLSVQTGAGDASTASPGADTVSHHENRSVQTGAGDVSAAASFGAPESQSFQTGAGDVSAAASFGAPGSQSFQTGAVEASAAASFGAPHSSHRENRRGQARFGGAPQSSRRKNHKFRPQGTFETYSKRENGGRYRGQEDVYGVVSRNHFADYGQPEKL